MGSYQELSEGRGTANLATGLRVQCRDCTYVRLARSVLRPTVLLGDGWYDHASLCVYRYTCLLLLHLFIDIPVPVYRCVCLLPCLFITFFRTYLLVCLFIAMLVYRYVCVSLDQFIDIPVGRSIWTSMG